MSLQPSADQTSPDEQTDIKSKAARIVSAMTLEEKASHCTGLDFWHTKSSEHLGIPSIMMTDGPHGLRKQAGESDHLGLHESVPATCFPTACATASSFDREILYEIGVAIGEECQQEEVAVVLGPGVNIKRSPLCGRNFEYFSEDPFLSGECATALINGVQSQGVGSCLKHYALNNQEKARMITDSVVDERAKREIYYTGFEMAVRNAQPWTMMCSYNKIDGVYASDNKVHLSNVLRDEWGFEGAVITDWGAMNDPVKAVEAGLDLEMPAESGFHAKMIVEAIHAGTLSEEALNKAATRMVELALRSTEKRKKGFTYDADAHHELARRAAAASCVLLKNEHSILPIQPTDSIAVIGQLAKKPRYQGAGSSKINPLHIECVYDALQKRNIEYSYADGYSLEKFAGPDETLIQEARITAKDKDAVLIFAGLPDEYESEGFDRSTLAMPQAHTELIDAISKVNPNIVVILQLGAPVVTPWVDKVKGLLLSYLGGQAGGAGCVDVLLGDTNPSGHLAESWPLALEDVSCHRYFPGNPKTVEYRESIFVGYRYYDTADMAVAWPFGYGLSYSSFEYRDLKLSSDSFSSGDSLTAQVTITNTGKIAGAEVVQLYVGNAFLSAGATVSNEDQTPPAEISEEVSRIYRAKHELKGFEKVFLEPGESKTLTFTLDDRSFAYYHAGDACWAIEGGTYRIEVGKSSREICLSETLSVSGDGREASLGGQIKEASEYFSLPKSNLTVSDSSFETVLGRPIPPATQRKGDPFTINSTLADLETTFIGRKVAKNARNMMNGLVADNEDTKAISDHMFSEMPLRALGLFSGGSLSPLKVEGIIDMCNGKIFRGARKLLKNE